MNPSIIVGTTAVMVGIVVALVMVLGTTDTGGVLPPMSTWVVSLPEGTEQTWYVDASSEDSTSLLITTTTEEKITYEEFIGDSKQTYTTMNYATVKAAYEDAKGDMDADVVEVYEAMWDSLTATTFKGDCVTVENPTIEEAESTLNGFQVTFGPDGEPTSIADSAGNTIADILSITEGIPEGTFGGCDSEEDRRQLEAFKARFEAVSEERKLGGMGSEIWAYVQVLFGGDPDAHGGAYTWCGPGTELCSRDCPGYGAAADFAVAEKACRRHDHGNYWTEHSFYNVLECGVDKHLVDAADNAAITTAYGSYSPLSGAWGCYNWESSQNCWWSYVNCGKGCGYWSRPCSTTWNWDRQYGPWRYDGINWNPPGGMYTAKGTDSYGTQCTSSTVSSCPGGGICGEGKTSAGACPGDLW